MKCLDEHLEHFAGGQQKKDINTTRLLIKFEEKKRGWLSIFINMIHIITLNTQV